MNVDLSNCVTASAMAPVGRKFGIEEFKILFRSLDSYSSLNRIHEYTDEEIFEYLIRDRDRVVFTKRAVNDAFLAWVAACKRASRIALSATGVPKGAENPTRDHIVILGEEISEAILR